MPNNSYQQDCWIAKSWVFSFLVTSLLRGTLPLCWALAKGTLLYLSLLLSQFQSAPPQTFYNIEMSILSLQEEYKMKEALVEQNGELGAVAHSAAWGEEQLCCSFALSQNSLYKTDHLCLRPKMLYSECRGNCHSKSCYSTACESRSVFGRGIAMLDLPQSMEHGRHPKELLSQWAALRSFSDGSAISFILSLPNCKEQGVYNSVVFVPHKATKLVTNT